MTQVSRSVCEVGVSLAFQMTNRTALVAGIQMIEKGTE